MSDRSARRVLCAVASAGLLAGSVALVAGSPAAAATTDAFPLREIVGASTGLDSVDMVALGAAGNVFALNSSAANEKLAVFGPTDTGNVAPSRLLTGSMATPLAVAVDASDTAFVGNCTTSVAASVTVYDATKKGADAPTRTLVGTNTKLRCPVAAAVSGSNLYVADSGGGSPTIGPAVNVYAAALGSNKAPTASIALSSDSEVRGLAIDSLGQVYVADAAANAVLVFAAGASTPASPIRTIVGAVTGLKGPQGLAVSTAGLLYVANRDGDSVTVYGKDANGNAAPVATLAGPSTALAGPRGLALSGDGGTLVVSNQTTNAITAYDAAFATPAQPGPAVTEVSPAFGATGGGTKITIKGSGFVDGSKASVGGNDAKAVFVSSTELSGETPPGTSGAADVVVSNPDRQSDVLVGGFTYDAAKAPGAPTNVSAQAGDSQATVSWSAPAADGGDPITLYEVSASPADPGTGEVHTCSTTGTLECTVVGLANETSYTFTAVAANSVGRGPASAPSGPVTPKTTPGAPSAPGNVHVARGNGSVDVSWDAAANNGSAVTDYTVSSNPASDGCTTKGALACTVTGLVNGSFYTFTVTATNAQGTGPASDPAGPAVPATVPTEPRAVYASGGPASADVSWAIPVSDGGDAVTEYRATAAPGGAFCTSSVALACKVAGLANGTSYTFTVTARNGVGTSPASAASDAVTPVDVPSRPAGVTGVRGNARATVSWRASLPNGRPITGYRVTASPGGRTCAPANAVGLTCTVTGLANGATYRFTVVATNDVGPSLASLASPAVVPATVATAPRSLKATYPRARVTSLIWAAPTNRGGLPVLRYEYRVSSNAGRTWKAWVRGTARQAVVVPGLLKARRYVIAVRAVNAAGAGAVGMIAIRPTK